MNDPGNDPRNNPLVTDDGELATADREGIAVETVVEHRVPPSTEITDEDLLDPGNMTPNAPPVEWG